MSERRFTNSLLRPLFAHSGRGLLLACFCLTLTACGLFDYFFSPAQIEESPDPLPVLWKLTGYDNGGLPWLDEQRVYFLGNHHRLVAVQKDSGHVLWAVDFPVLRNRTVGFGGFTTDGKVIVGDQWLFALDTADGRELWRFAPPEGVDVGRDIPERWNDLVLTGSSNGLVFGVELATGNERWVTRVGPDRKVGTWIAPVFAGTLYVGITDFEAAENGEPQGAVAALDAATGAVLWQRDIPHHADSLSPTATIDPVVLGPVVVVGARDGPIYAFDRVTGAPRWTLGPMPMPNVTDPRFIRDVHSLAACGNTLVIGSSSSTIVLAADPETGAELWRTPRSPAAAYHVGCDDRTVYVYRPLGTMEALDLQAGTLRWRLSGEFDFSWGFAVEAERLYAGSITALYSFRRD